MRTAALANRTSISNHQMSGLVGDSSSEQVWTGIQF